MKMDYERLTADELVAHLIDGICPLCGEESTPGLAKYLDTQQKGIPREDWDWFVITRDLQAFTRGLLTFSPEYLEELYEMQVARLVV